MSNELKDKINEWMLKKDSFSKELGMEIVSVTRGCSEVKLIVTSKMANGFGMAHGAITYALSDSAFAFACNSYGEVAVSIETSISHLKKVNLGDVLTAKASEISKSRKIGIYKVAVINQQNEIVSDFKGTCYFLGREHEPV